MKMIKVIISIILLSTFFISNVYSGSPPTTYANLVIKNDHSLQIEYYNLNNGSFINQYNINNNGYSPVSIVSAESYGILYISYSKQNSQYCLNYYDIESNSTKYCISTIQYQYQNIDFYYQPTISSRPSTYQKSYVYNLIGFGNMGWLSYLILNFENGYWNETRANIDQSSNFLYNTGYDYFSNTYYTTYLCYSNCLRYDFMNATTLKWFDYSPRYCVSTLDKNDRAIPIIYNSTKYLLTSYYNSKEIIMKRIDIIDGHLNSTDLFKFINIPNSADSYYTPYFFVDLRDEYLTVATYTNFGKIQVNIVNLNTFSTSSTLIPATYSSLSIITF